MNSSPVHQFHIPVMGLAYTIDSPLKVARFGIASVISIVEDRLIEMMRRYYYPQAGKTYVPITAKEPDYRARRITDYLNLVQGMVQEQMEKLRSEAFERGSEIVKYFEMLPPESRLKKLYEEMLICVDGKEILSRQNYLRSQIQQGSIDVNIMTKADREVVDHQGMVVPDGSDAVAALRGYMQSDLNHSAIVFSAGMNPRLYSYLEKFRAFDPDENLHFKKKVIVKVSDFRSALIQGKFLAKKGIWVSEFRIESGLNCGGHAFATDGFLMGPILEEFKTKRESLRSEIFEIYKTAIRNKLGYDLSQVPETRISVQGGIGTAEENSFLLSHYHLDSTGWGSPFLLVPEATTTDAATLELLCKAEKKDVVLSNYSPLGVRFYYLKGTTAEREKETRAALGKPGSPCTEKHLSFNTEFTKEPICTASQKYQKLKLEHLETLGLETDVLEKQKQEVVAKECLCVGLSNSAALVYEQPFLKNMKAVNICPGPNIANFSQVVSLQKMVDHIYGRTNIMTNPDRPHLFIAELKMYLDYLKSGLLNGTEDAKQKSYFQSFANNLSDAIAYYKNLPANVIQNRGYFDQELEKAVRDLDNIKSHYSLSA